MTGTDTHRCVAGKDCRDAENVTDTTTGRTSRRGTTIPQETGLCEPCTRTALYAVEQMPETWLALHVSIGQATAGLNQKVAITRASPVGINTEADALKASIVEWLVAAAARISELLNTDPPEPVNNTDTAHAHTTVACARLISPNIDRLIALPPDDVTVWMTPAETQYPGERFYIDELGTPHTGIKIIPLSGAELALQFIRLRRKARSFLALTNPIDKLALPCPRCNEYELTRRHERRPGNSHEIDQIECGACHLNWPYEQYRNLTLIWVKEDEMERDKLRKQLEAETARRQHAEACLAKREWQLSLALDCPDVSAKDFATTVLANTDPPDVDAYMTDKDVANLIGVADSTIRSWASRGTITRHTSADGSTVFHARQVWEYAKTQIGARTATARRLTNERKAGADLHESGLSGG